MFWVAIRVVSQWFSHIGSPWSGGLGREKHTSIGPARRLFILCSYYSVLRMHDPSTLRPATTDELEHALAHALRFDGQKAFRTSGEMMATITAAHLVAYLRRAGFVVMKAPPAPAHKAPP